MEIPAFWRFDTLLYLAACCASCPPRSFTLKWWVSCLSRTVSSVRWSDVSARGEAAGPMSRSTGEGTVRRTDILPSSVDVLHTWQFIQESDLSTVKGWYFLRLNFFVAAKQAQFGTLCPLGTLTPHWNFLMCHCLAPKPYCHRGNQYNLFSYS